ncbi:unnamed protein product [Pleuronectes platessa]|uniref:Uncharacterized protein n=1 Tax=Pleuronectes platessa TaxID=8262 RepID=A0A9N7VKU3_PLEPL|nr:unnamed protein product [Pleuronectes platessa]
MFEALVGACNKMRSPVFVHGGGETAAAVSTLRSAAQRANYRLCKKKHRLSPSPPERPDAICSRGPFPSAVRSEGSPASEAGAAFKEKALAPCKSIGQIAEGARLRAALQETGEENHLETKVCHFRSAVTHCRGVAYIHAHAETDRFLDMFPTKHPYPSGLPGTGAQIILSGLPAVQSTYMGWKGALWQLACQWRPDPMTTNAKVLRKHQADRHSPSSIRGHCGTVRHEKTSPPPRKGAFVVGTQHDQWPCVVGHLFAPLEAGLFTVTVALYSPGNLLSGTAGGLLRRVLTICVERGQQSLREGVAAQVLDIRDQR